MKDSIKKRLNKLHKELTTPQADCLVATRYGINGFIVWMGKTYRDESELEPDLKYYGITHEKPLVIITRYNYDEFGKKIEQSLTNEIDKGKS